MLTVGDPHYQTLRPRAQFVVLLEYDGDDFEAKEREYYASAARAALDPDPAQWIARAEHYVVQSVLAGDYGR